MGPRAVLLRPELLSFEGLSATLPRRNVMWLLPRRAESRETAGESRGAPMGEFELDCGCTVFLDRPHLCVEPRPVEFLFSDPARVAAGLDRHFAGVERQHQ